MNEITGLSELGLTRPREEAKPNGELGQEDFLTLMITQFQNQDPFEPMENGDFLSQLAQFGTVNGIEQLNSSFGSLQNSIQSEQALQAANLVGHKILASNDTAFLGAGDSVRGAVELDASVSNIEVDITDLNGQFVRRLELGQRQPGLAEFQWDGVDAAGQQVEPGHYYVQTRLIRGGNIESAETLLESGIESVSLGRFGEGLTLNLLGGDTMSLNRVRRIL